MFPITNFDASKGKLKKYKRTSNAKHYVLCNLMLGLSAITLNMLGCGRKMFSQDKYGNFTLQSVVILPPPQKKIFKMGTRP